ncbi:hypothetical protein GUJ93_ZPchr0458g22725 [Zizania palustris]|nr:hypothetical protein GUJ93_ZPchr0458g22725 [Zizania palustris]
MQPRSRIRGREPPPPPSSGGRYRRRSPSPRHPRRGRDPPPPSQPHRRSPDRSRRHEDRPPPDVLGAGDRRSRADILLDVSRLAAHYLVAQGVLPEHLLQAREDPKHNPSSRPEPPAAGGYARKRDDTYHDDDQRWRRNGCAANWGRDKRDDDRLSRRSGWDKRSHSFDERRKYNDGGGGVDPGGRRSHEYDEQRRPTMSRSYSQNDRRPSSDVKVDRRRRSRSRSRTRTRSSNLGSSRRDSDWRAGSGELDHTKVSEPVIVHDGDLDLDDTDDMPRDLKAPPRSVVVVETNEDASQAAAMENTEVESEIIGFDHGQDNCGDENGENADVGFNDADVGEINTTKHQLSSSNLDDVHLSGSDEEPVSRQSQFSDAEGGMEAPESSSDACSIEPVAEEIRDGMEALQTEVKTDVGDLSKDEQELPAWYGIFDLNVVESQENCEMAGISSDPPLDDGCDSVPDLVGHMSQRANCGASGTQGQGEHAVDNQQVEDARLLLNQSIGTHDFNKYDLSNEQRIGNQTADEHGHDNIHQLEDDEMHINHGMDVHGFHNYLLKNEEMLLKQCADEHEYHKHETETEQILLNQGQGTSVQALDNYHMNGEQLLVNHGAGEHSDDDHPIKNEQMLINHVVGVHDLNNYDLSSEQILLNNGADKQAAYSGWLKEGQMQLDQAADGKATLHNQGIARMVRAINLEDDCDEQPDMIQFLESK